MHSFWSGKEMKPELLAFFSPAVKSQNMTKIGVDAYTRCLYTHENNVRYLMDV